MDGGASAALIAGSGILSGVGGMVGNNQSAQNAKDQAGLARVQANQTDTAYREDLMSTISNIRAIRASSGVGANSPTGQAIEERQAQLSDRNRVTAVTGKRFEASSQDRAAGAYQTAGLFSLAGGAVKGLSSLKWS
jgi:hypothetical protein